MLLELLHGACEGVAVSLSGVAVGYCEEHHLASPAFHQGRGSVSFQQVAFLRGRGVATNPKPAAGTTEGPACPPPPHVTLRSPPRCTAAASEPAAMPLDTAAGRRYQPPPDRSYTQPARAGSRSHAASHPPPPSRDLPPASWDNRCGRASHGFDAPDLPINASAFRRRRFGETVVHNSCRGRVDRRRGGRRESLSERWCGEVLAWKVLTLLCSTAPV